MVVFNYTAGILFTKDLLVKKIENWTVDSSPQTSHFTDLLKVFIVATYFAIFIDVHSLKIKKSLAIDSRMSVLKE